MLLPPIDTNGERALFKIPFGNSYGYSTANQLIQ